MSKQVSVPSAFFIQTALRDYTSPFRSIIRELLQNSRDAGATNVDFGLTNTDGLWTLICSDNGAGMTRDIIENKLMALGETTKEGTGATGGFGVAKILLFFSQRAYSIHTNDLFVSGHGSGWDLRPSSSVTKGTTVVLTLEPKIVARESGDKVEAIRREIRSSHLPKLAITVNGECIHASSRAGNTIATIQDKIRIRRTKLPAGTTTCYAAVRVRGLFMFNLFVGDCNSRFHIELDGYSTEILTSNRDGFQRGGFDWAHAVQAVCHEFVTNSQARKEEGSKQYSFKGDSSYQASEFKSEDRRRIEAKVNLILKDQMAALSQGFKAEEIKRETQAAVEQALSEEAHLPSVMQAVLAQVNEIIESGCLAGIRLARNYHVYTEGFKKLPVAWRPENNAGWKQDLLDLWSAIVGKTLVVAGHANTNFEVGFAIYHDSVEDKALALHAPRDGISYYYLNPKSYGDETMLPIINKKRRPELIMWLMDLAAHEVTHFLGKSGHNEDFVVTEADLRRKQCEQWQEFLSLGGKTLIDLKKYNEE